MVLILVVGWGGEVVPKVDNVLRRKLLLQLLWMLGSCKWLDTVALSDIVLAWVIWIRFECSISSLLPLSATIGVIVSITTITSLFVIILTDAIATSASVIIFATVWIWIIIWVVRLRLWTVERVEDVVGFRLEWNVSPLDLAFTLHVHISTQITLEVIHVWLFCFFFFWCRLLGYFFVLDFQWHQFC